MEFASFEDWYKFYLTHGAYKTVHTVDEKKELERAWLAGCMTGFFRTQREYIDMAANKILKTSD